MCSCGVCSAGSGCFLWCVIPPISRMFIDKYRIGVLGDAFTLDGPPSWYAINMKFPTFSIFRPFRRTANILMMTAPAPKGSITINLDTNEAVIKYVKLTFLVEAEDAVAYYDMQGGRQDTWLWWGEESSPGRDSAPSAIILGCFGSIPCLWKEQIDDLPGRIRAHREQLVKAVPIRSVLREMMRRQKGRGNEGKIRRDIKFPSERRIWDPGTWVRLTRTSLALRFWFRDTCGWIKVPNPRISASHSFTSNVLYALEGAVPFAEAGTFLPEHRRPCLMWNNICLFML